VLAKLGSAASSAFFVVMLLLVFVGPWLVYVVFPVPAYRITEAVAFLAFTVGLIALLVGVIPKARRGAGAVVSLAALAIMPFWWVWSVIIVGQHWGIGMLYFLNLFLGVGALLGAFVASLFSGEWAVLGQLVLIAVITTVFYTVGNAFAGTE